MSRNIAIILAGGSGSRFGTELPKQFLPFRGRTIIEHTIDAFEQNPLIEEIAVVTLPAFVHTVEEMIQRNGYRKLARILLGGEQRYQSSLAAVEAYPDDDDVLIFHDAVRPLLSQRIINDCVAAMQQYDAVDVAVKTVDTIIQVNQDRCIQAVPPRASLMNGQTPQCFRRGTIRRAYRKALRDPSFSTTDDCGVVLRYLPEVPIYVVEGEYSNMKLTNQEDLQLLDKYFETKKI